MNVSVDNSGYLELIWGPMFCGKTSSLLHKLSLHKMCGKRVLYVNSDIDTRTDGGFSTHNPLIKDSLDIDQIKVHKLMDVMERAEGYDVIGIDESQFFDDLVPSVKAMVISLRKIVYVGGLTGDSNMGLFGNMFRLIPMSNKVTTLSAICEVCSKGGCMREANFTKRIVADTESILVGGHDAYIPVCRECYYK